MRKQGAEGGGEKEKVSFKKKRKEENFVKHENHINKKTRKKYIKMNARVKVVFIVKWV